MSYSPLAYRQSWLLARGPSNPFDPASDPLGAGYLNARPDPTAGLTLTRGLVVDSVAYCNAYRVHLEGMAPPLICTLAGHAGFGAMGARELATLPPGCRVLVAWRPGAPCGTIVAVEPPTAADPALALAGRLALSSRSGIAVDAAHQALFACADGGGVPAWPAGRPRDATTAGEWGAICETGARVAVDSAMAQLAVDEATGVFAFYHDQLLRLAGVNLQEFSAAHLREAGDDEGESYYFSGWTPYPWEQLGVLAPGGDATRAVPAAESQGSTPYLAPREPAYDDQVPFHRRVWIGGYPGQGGKDLVLAPPGPAVAVARLSDAPDADHDATAVLEEQRTLAGHYLLRAAGGVHITRQATIPAPRRLKRAEDATGDAAANYNPAGVGSNGPPHKVTAGLAAPPVADDAPPIPPGQAAAAVLDELARLRNWEGEHGLAYHARDWRVPEESDTAVAAAVAAAAADPSAPSSSAPSSSSSSSAVSAPPTTTTTVADLATRYAIDPPAAVPVVVDARYGAVDVVPSEAGLHLLADGSIVLRDGFGSTITLTGGNVIIDPAGDLLLRPGRSVVALAGRDVSLRARGSLEASAATGDLRLKAEANLHALAGNSGSGGLLLESRGADAYTYKDRVGTDVVSGGIQMKSAGSVVSWAKGYYLRALDQGDIVLDADKGAGSVYQWCDQSVRYLTTSATDYFGAPTKVAAANTFSPEGAVLAGGLSALGECFATGGMTMGGDVNIVGGNVYSDQAGDGGGQVGGYGPGGARVVKARLADQDKAQQGLTRQGQDAYKQGLLPAYYATGKPGDATLIGEVAFSFRSTDQYKAKDFCCWETAWQQRARLTKLDLGTWTEPKVAAGNQATYPYPGAQAWARDQDYYTQDLGLYDAKAGCAVPRGKNRAAYEQPAYLVPKTLVLDGNYAIVDPE